MTRDVAVDVLKAWESVILQRESAGHFRVAVSPPAWLAGFIDAPTVGTIVAAGVVFPYLETFLVDAEAFWEQGREGRLKSDPWVETDASGADWPLDAIATWTSGTSLLVIRHLGEDFARDQATWQVARDNLLNQEHLEREVQRRTEKIREREEELVFRLLDAAGFRNEETGAHIRRIGLFAEEMAKALGWRARDIRRIRLAAPMHDIGKIGVPDHVLLKAGRLTDEETAVMRTHAEIGGKMLDGSDIPALRMAAEIARCHHERWDGGGYPAGSSGNDIPESARIVSIVDVFDAMRHERVYKPAIEEEVVLETLRAESGKHFEPRMVDAFFSRLARMRQILDEVPDGRPRWVPASEREDGTSR